jgi:hypothetical protein
VSAVRALALDDHVHVDVGVGQGAEDGRRHAGMVGQAEEADLRLVAAVGHAAHDPLLHDLLLVAHDGALAGRFARLDKTRQHPHGHIVGHGQLDRAGLQHLGAQGRHLQHLLIGDLGQLPGLALDRGSVV